MTYHVAACPLGNCLWESDPLPNERQAVEAVRTHLMRLHSHADLIEYTIIGVKAERYKREGE